MLRGCPAEQFEWLGPCDVFCFRYQSRYWFKGKA
jgi:hypothetical protein